jgi:hypothetical protein
VVQLRVPRVKVEIEHFLDVELVGTRIAEEQTGGHGDEGRRQSTYSCNAVEV